MSTTSRIHEKGCHTAVSAQQADNSLAAEKDISKLGGIVFIIGLSVLQLFVLFESCAAGWLFFCTGLLNLSRVGILI